MELCRDIDVSPREFVVFRVESSSGNQFRRFDFEVKNISLRKQTILISILNGSDPNWIIGLDERKRQSMRFHLAPGLSYRGILRVQGTINDNEESQMESIGTILVTCGKEKQITIPVRYEMETKSADGDLIFHPSILNFGKLPKNRLEMMKLSIRNISSVEKNIKLRTSTASSGGHTDSIQLSQTSGRIDPGDSLHCFVELVPETEGLITEAVEIEEYTRSTHIISHRIDIRSEIIPREIEIVDERRKNVELILFEPISFGKTVSERIFIRNVSSVLSSYAITVETKSSSDSNSALHFSMLQGDILPNSSSPLIVSVKTYEPSKFSIEKEDYEWRCHVEVVATGSKQTFTVKASAVKVILSASSTSLDFGNVVPGNSKRMEFALTNVNKVLPVNWAIKCPAHFHALRDSGSLPTGGRISFDIVFRPRQLGIFHSHAVLIYNGKRENIRLSGTSSTDLTLIASGDQSDFRMTSPRIDTLPTRTKSRRNLKARKSALKEVTPMIVPWNGRVSIRECDTKLTQYDISSIKPSAHRIDFGTVSIFEEISRPFSVSNGHSKCISVEVRLSRNKDGDNFVKLEGSDFVYLGPQGIATFLLKFQASQEGDFFTFAEYLINKIYAFKIVLKAEVHPKIVTVSAEELIFRIEDDSMDFTQTAKVELTNKSSAEAKITLSSGGTHFRVDESQILVKPNSVYSLPITFNPSTGGQEFAETITYAVQGGDKGAIACKGFVSEGRGEFDQGHVSFCNLGIGIMHSIEIVFKSKARQNSTLVAVNPASLPHFLTVNPSARLVKEGGTGQFKISLCCDEQLSIDSLPITFHIRGGTSMTIFVSAQVDEPHIEIIQDCFEFGRVFIGNEKEIQCKIMNKGDCYANMVIDLGKRALGEFTFSDLHFSAGEASILPEEHHDLFNSRTTAQDSTDTDPNQETQPDIKIESHDNCKRSLSFRIYPKGSISFSLCYRPMHVVL